MNGEDIVTNDQSCHEPKQQGINNSHHFGPLAQREDVPAYLMHSYFVQFKKRHDSGCIFKTEETS